MKLSAICFRETISFSNEHHRASYLEREGWHIDMQDGYVALARKETPEYEVCMPLEIVKYFRRAGTPLHAPKVSKDA